MSNSPASYARSGHCRPNPEARGARIHWRPSRLLRGALALLTLAACASILLCELPTPWAWPAMAVVAAAGARAIHAESRRRPRELVIDASGRVWLDGEHLQGPALHWRGPILRLDWEAAGRRRSLLWWPDTLPPAQRRALRLLASSIDTPPSRESMAP